MELTALGFDGWFEQRSAALLQTGQSMARVTAVDRGAFLIRNQDAETYAQLAGKLRFRDSVGRRPAVRGRLGVRAAPRVERPCHHSWRGAEEDVPAPQVPRQDRGLSDDRGKH